MENICLYETMAQKYIIVFFYLYYYYYFLLLVGVGFSSKRSTEHFKPTPKENCRLHPCVRHSSGTECKQSNVQNPSPATCSQHSFSTNYITPTIEAYKYSFMPDTSVHTQSGIIATVCCHHTNHTSNSRKLLFIPSGRC